MSSHASPHCDPSMWEKGQDMHTGPMLHLGNNVAHLIGGGLQLWCNMYKEDKERLKHGQVEDQPLGASVFFLRGYATWSFWANTQMQKHTRTYPSQTYANPCAVI